MREAIAMLLLSAALLLSAGLGACRAPGAGGSEAGAPTLSELRSATYTGIEESPGPVTLVDGAWQGAPYDSGGASRPSVLLLSDLRPVGDLTGDGRADAVALLTATAGGTGEMTYVALMSRSSGRLSNVATAALGDRVKIRAVRIESGEFVADLVQAGPTDAMCCPGDLATRRWKFAAGRLVESTPVITGRLSPEAFAGHDWVLTRWAWDEAAPLEPQVTLRYADGRLSGSAGCNNYTTACGPGDAPADLKLGPAAATRKMCPPPEMAVEDRFLKQLGTVRSFSFMAGQLVLEYEHEGGRSSMMFAARDSM